MQHLQPANHAKQPQSLEKKKRGGVLCCSCLTLPLVCSDVGGGFYSNKGDPARSSARATVKNPMGQPSFQGMGDGLMMTNVGEQTLHQKKWVSFCHRDLSAAAGRTVAAQICPPPCARDAEISIAQPGQLSPESPRFHLWFIPLLR